MKRRERRKLYTCDKKGLIELINDPKYKGDKEKQFNAIIEYLARNEMVGSNTKNDVFDLAYTARSALIAQEAKEHINDDGSLTYESVVNVKHDVSERIKNFIKDPYTALRGEFTLCGQRLNDMETNDPDVEEYNHKVVRNIPILYKMMSLGVESKKVTYGSNQDNNYVMSRLYKAMDKKDKTFDDSIKRINSGVFGRLFRRPSKEYKDFEYSFNLFRRTGNPNSGNVEDLEKKTTKYLKHLIHDFDAKKIGENKAHWLECLPKGQRKRAEFALNVMEAVHEHKEEKAYIDNVDKALRGKPYDKDLGNPKANIIDKQVDFQKDLGKDLNEEIINTNSKKVVKKIEGMKEIDEEKLDASEDSLVK